MSALKDPKIKLFGKTIDLLDTSAAGEAIGSFSVRCTEPLHTSHQEPPCSSVSNKNLSDSKKDDDPNEPKNRASKPCEEEEEENESGDSPNKDKTALKKPDEILLCPRCSSSDTKFCYFNNYNVNQPRHSCKNCQRYWTAGGSMRSTPIGAGRRKIKNPSSSVSPSPYALCHKGTDTAPLCESMASALSIEDKNGALNLNSNGDTGRPGSTRTVQYPWNPSASNFPIPYYYGAPTPPPYWAWNFPRMVSPSSSSSSPPTTLGKHSREDVGCLLKEDSSAEGEEGILSVKQRSDYRREEKSLRWAPKASRIDDGEEAAARKSNSMNCNNNNGLLFRGFEGVVRRGKSKGDEEKAIASSWILQANPAAFSRSLRFHESSYSSF